jgi:hypothetical protein
VAQATAHPRLYRKSPPRYARQFLLTEEDSNANDTRGPARRWSVRNSADKLLKKVEGRRPSEGACAAAVL